MEQQEVGMLWSVEVRLEEFLIETHQYKYFYFEQKLLIIVYKRTYSFLIPYCIFLFINQNSTRLYPYILHADLIESLLIRNMYYL